MNPADIIFFSFCGLIVAGIIAYWIRNAIQTRRINNFDKTYEARKKREAAAAASGALRSDERQTDPNMRPPAPPQRPARPSTPARSSVRTPIAPTRYHDDGSGLDPAIADAALAAAVADELLNRPVETSTPSYPAAAPEPERPSAGGGGFGGGGASSSWGGDSGSSYDSGGGDD